MKKKNKKSAYFTEALWNDYCNAWNTAKHNKDFQKMLEKLQTGLLAHMLMDVLHLM